MKKVLNFLKVLRNEKKSPIHEYIDLVLSFNHQKLPKSTTCCWRLTKNYDNLIMYQFFVAPYDKFCINLSSNILSNNRCVGATFYSSMFYHVTSVPVWYRKNGSVSLNGPHDMYNFAWGSDGRNRTISSTISLTYLKRERLLMMDWSKYLWYLSLLVWDDLSE